MIYLFNLNEKFLLIVNIKHYFLSWFRMTSYEESELEMYQYLSDALDDVVVTPDMSGLRRQS